MKAKERQQIRKRARKLLRYGAALQRAATTVEMNVSGIGYKPPPMSKKQRTDWEKFYELLLIQVRAEAMCEAMKHLRRAARKSGRILTQRARSEDAKRRKGGSE